MSEAAGHHKIKSTEALKKEFDSLDKDKNGFVTKDELKKFMMADGLSAEDFETLFVTIDWDGSGHVDWTEYVLFNVGRFDAVKEYELIFKIIDADNDGFLDVTELKKCAKSLRREEGDMAEIIANLDKDGDGKVSLKEWLALVADDN